jgi:hypothetical protein
VVEQDAGGQREKAGEGQERRRQDDAPAFLVEIAEEQRPDRDGRRQTERDNERA